MKTRVLAQWWPVYSVALLSTTTGCSLFSSTRHTPIGQTHVAAGTAVSLAEEVRADWRGMTSRTLVLRVGDEGRAHRVEVSGHKDKQYRLHTVDDSERVFLVGYPSLRVVFSMDIATDETWEGDVTHPHWAATH